MKVFNSTMWRIASAVAIFLAFSQGASAQPFLRKYNKITEKNLPKFITSWESWSDSLACEAKGEDLNALTKQVNKDISEEMKKYLENVYGGSRYFVLQTDISVRVHSGARAKRKPHDKDFNDDVVESYSIIPLVETDKPILYLNNEIADKIVSFINGKDRWERIEKLNGYFKVLPDEGGYHICSLPYISTFDVFTNCIVVSCREDWGSGSSIIYYKEITGNEELFYRKGRTIESYMR